MGCSLSAIADDEDRYYSLCQKYNQGLERDETGDVDFYGLHGKMLLEFNKRCYYFPPAKLKKEIKKFNKDYKRAVEGIKSDEKNAKIRFSDLKAQLSESDWKIIERGIEENW